MSGGFLKRLEIDAVWPPVNNARIFVELGGEAADVGRSGCGPGQNLVYVDGRNVAVCVKKVWRRERGREGELLSIRRKDRAAVGAVERDNFVHGVVVGEVGDVNILITAEREKRIGRRGVSDQRGIGRPGKIKDVESFIVRDLAGLCGEEIA